MSAPTHSGLFACSFSIAIILFACCLLVACKGSGGRPGAGGGSGRACLAIFAQRLRSARRSARRALLAPFSGGFRCMAPFSGASRCSAPFSGASRCSVPLSGASRCMAPFSGPSGAVPPLVGPSGALPPSVGPSGAVSPSVPQEQAKGPRGRLGAGGGSGRACSATFAGGFALPFASSGAPPRPSPVPLGWQARGAGAYPCPEGLRCAHPWCYKSGALAGGGRC